MRGQGRCRRNPSCLVPAGEDSQLGTVPVAVGSGSCRLGAGPDVQRRGEGSWTTTSVFQWESFRRNVGEQQLNSQSFQPEMMYSRQDHQHHFILTLTGHRSHSHVSMFRSIDVESGRVGPNWLDWGIQVVRDLRQPATIPSRTTTPAAGPGQLGKLSLPLFPQLSSTTIISSPTVSDPIRLEI
ncbi:hypothetical protein B0T20DRAFT_151049 [Sordaria brevicollis]|uniref:Uncharacterized protein n=1 Tax=Sordaria brevicollis TaxID=83679 RepID=A0AAE0PIR6_SORBR|nr:hypothetical protein B0T20DRAFT_151049 [Sordaria brevicollis]